MTYTPTTWVNKTPPAINQANLNQIEHGVDIAQGDVMQLYGLAGARPAFDAELVGRIYTETDTPYSIWRDNGVGWDLIGFAVDATGDLHPASAKIGGAVNYADFAADGELTLVGTARALSDMWIGAEGLRAPPAVKPATLVVHGISVAWEFSDGTDDTIVANMRIPNRMDITVAPTITMGWSSPVADPGDNSKQATWQVEYLWTAPDESTIAAAQATVPVTTSASTVANGITISTVTLAAPDVGDECVHLRIKRRGDTDSLGGVANLSGICMQFTSDRLGT